MPRQLKVKIYKTTVRAVLLYGAELDPTMGSMNEGRDAFGNNVNENGEADQGGDRGTGDASQFALICTHSADG